MASQSSVSKKHSRRNGLDADKQYTKSSLAGLAFPVSRVHRYMKEGGYSQRVSVTGAVFLTSILEYLAAEILELAGKVSTDLGKQRIKPRFIMLAIRQDDELSSLLRNVTIRDAGVPTNLHEALLPNRMKDKLKNKKGGYKNKKGSQYSDSQTY